MLFSAGLNPTRSQFRLQAAATLALLLIVSNILYFSLSKTKPSTLLNSIRHSFQPWHKSSNLVNSSFSFSSSSHQIHPYLKDEDKSSCIPRQNPLPTLQPYLPSNSHPQSLLRYIRMHRKYRHCLEGDKNPYAKSDPACAPEFVPPVLIWTCPSIPCAGVGDRLNFIMLAFLIALTTDRLFFIDWPNFNSNPNTTFLPLHLGLAPARIDWRLPKNLSLKSAEDIPFIQLTDLNDTMLIKYENSTLTSKTSMSKQEQFNFLSDDYATALKIIPILRLYARIPNRHFTYVLNNPYTMRAYPDLQPYSKHASKSYFRFMRALFHTLFQPSFATQHRIRHLKLQEYTKKPYVALHFRTGLDIEPDDHRFLWAHLITPEELAKTLLDCIQLVHKQSSKSNKSELPRRIFVAADSIKVKNALSKIAIEKGFHVFYVKQKRPVVHTASRHIDKQHGCEDFLDVFTDMTIMSKAKAFLSTGSYLAEAAFLLGSSVEKQYIIPRNDKLACEKIWRDKADYHDIL